MHVTCAHFGVATKILHTPQQMCSCAPDRESHSDVTRRDNKYFFFHVKLVSPSCSKAGPTPELLCGKRSSVANLTTFLLDLVTFQTPLATFF